MDSLECFADSISNDKIHFIASNGELIDCANTRDSSVKLNGKYSCCLNKSNMYGFGYHNMAIKPGDILKVSVWKYPAIKDTGNLVVSCGKDFFKTAFDGRMDDDSCWEQLELYVIVPPDASDFKIYAINDKQTNVWFDDLKIIRYPAN